MFRTAIDEMNHQIHVKESKEILQYNRKRIYKLPKKFEYLQLALEPMVEQLLLDIIAYWLKKDCIGYGSHGMVYFLSTHNGTYAVRKKTTRGVTNRYINYLCALGLLKKLEQRIMYGYDQRERRYLRKNIITIVNRNHLKYDKNQNLEPINTFEVFKYTTEVLEECNKRAERLLNAKITPGNISYNQLAINGMEDIAKEIYIKDRKLSVEKKIREYEILVECIDFLISEKGYTTKQEIFDNCQLEDKELEKLFKIFKQKLKESYNYKAPTKEDKEKFELDTDKWILTHKETIKISDS